MAKNKVKKSTSLTAEQIRSSSGMNKNVISFEKYQIFEKYFWLIIPVLTVIYFISSKYSVGFYQDDEIGQYINMIKFWSDPFAILGNSPKPGYKIFMVIPALFSYETVLLVNAFIASLSVYFTYVLLKVYKINYAFFGALLLSVQPLFFDLSFRSYSEIFTALLILIVLILYKKDLYIWTGIVCGYIFTVRQEIALLIIIFAVIFYKKKNYTAIAALAVFPIIYDLLGFIKTGDILFVLTEMQSLGAYAYKSQGVFHYFNVYIFIIGPVTLLLFLFGFFGFIADTRNYKNYLNEFGIFYLVFISIFAVQVMTMFSSGANPGNWRYLLHISPVASVFATIGLNNLSKPDFRKTSYILTGILAFLTLVFFSKTTDGFILHDVSDYTKFFIIVFSFILILTINKMPVTDYLNKLSVALLILAVVNLFLSFNPKKLSSENALLKQTSDYLNTIDIHGKELFYNHTFIPFYSDNLYRESPDNFKRLITENLKSAKTGSVIIWDSHYSYRPTDMKNDVKLEDLKNSADYKLLNSINSSDGRYSTFIFEKIN